MLVALELPPNLAAAVEREASRNGQSPSAWLLDRLSDRFGLRWHVPVLVEDEDGPDYLQDDGA